MSRNMLNLDDLLKKKQRIFVKNNSISAGLMIVLEMKDRNGKGRALKIPPTEVPVCLTDMFSRDMLENSQDLRIALTKQNLVLIDEKTALEILARPESQAQIKTFNMSIYADGSPGNPVKDSLAKVARKSKKVHAKTDLLKKTQQQEDVNVRVKAVIGSFKSKEKNAKDTQASLLRMKSGLTKADLNYVMQECSEDQTLKKFAETTLAEIAAGPEQPFEN